MHPGKWHAVDGHGTEGIKQDLEGAEEGLAQDGVKENGLEGGGEIGVEAVDAEGLVVGQVVGLVFLLACLLWYCSGRGKYPKGSAVWQANGQVGKDGKEPVGHGRPEGEVVRDLMDGEE